MRICFYGYGLVTPGGGTSQYTHALAARLAEEGHEVTVVTRRWPNAVMKTEGVRYHFLSIDSKPSLPFRNIQYALKSILYFLRHGKDYDLIHSMSGFESFAVLAALIRRCVQVPMVYSVLSPFRSRVIVKSFDQVICVSHNIEQRLKGPNSIYIPPFIETERFKVFSQYDFRKDSRVIIGTTGYPFYRKGTRYLVETIPLILERFPEALILLAIDLPAIRFIEKLSREKRDIENRIKTMGLQRNVRILGAVDVPRFLNSLDLYIYPVQTTAGMIDIPPTVLECLAAGCGLVTSRQGGIEEVVEDGYNGALVPQGEHSHPRAYADRIVELMENKSLLERLRRNGPPSVEPFDIRKIAPQILRVYERMVNTKG